MTASPVRTSPPVPNSAAGTGIVVILEEFRVGGLERAVLAQVRGLLDRGFAVTVAVLIGHRHNPLVAELDERVELVALPGNPFRRWAALRVLTRDRIVMIHLGSGRLYPSIRPGLTGSRRVVRFCHSDYSHLRGRWKNLLDRWVATTDSVIVAVGGRSTGFMTGDVGVPAAKVVTLPNVIPEDHRAVDAFPVFTDAAPAAPRLVAVADFSPHKGQEVVLRALARITAVTPEAALVLIGDGPRALELWRLARELGVLPRITWLGATWHGGIVRQTVRSCGLFVSMSRAEGIPISVLEARQEGVPMVLSDIPGHRDGAGEDATYVPVDDDIALAQAVLEVWRDGHRRTPRPAAAEPFDAYLARLISILQG